LTFDSNNEGKSVDQSSNDVPLINGPNWVFDLVRIVVETISKFPNASKKEARDILRRRLQQKFVKEQDDGWRTVRGDVLKTEKELHRHLDWTWLDQYAIPMSVNLSILAVTRERYRLTAHGEKLAASLKKDAFEDTLRNVIILVDQQNWNVLNIIKEQGPIDFDGVKAALEKSGVGVRKEDHLRKLLTLLKTVGLLRDSGRSQFKIYELSEERYLRSSKLLTYNAYDSVNNQAFVDALFQAYREKAKLGSPYVEIDQLRPTVSRLLNWPEEYFNRRLKEIPLRIGSYQLLFSQAAFAKLRSVEREGMYFDYLSIYTRQ
jgi:hypothetical protein